MPLDSGHDYGEYPPRVRHVRGTVAPNILRDFFRGINDRMGEHMLEDIGIESCVYVWSYKAC